MGRGEASAEFSLRDGSPISVRPIRPSDRELLRQMFERSSAESRFRRFLTPMRALTGTELTYLTEVDHRDHEALIALEPETGEGVGVARYVRTGPETAEAAVTVVDDWQGRGVGSLLLERLATRASTNAYRRFSARVLRSNREVLSLLRQLGPVEMTDADSGTVEIVVELPIDGAGSHLRELLRHTARDETEVAPPGEGDRNASG